MTRPDFSDLYKFFVSAGVIFLTLAITIPWLFLRESFDILLSQAEFDSLTSAARQLIKTRQEAAVWITANIGYISGVLLLFGIGFVIYGINLWWQRQTILDQKQELEKQKLEYEVKAMTPKEVTHKAVQRLEVVQSEEFEFEWDKSHTSLALANYLAIKVLVSEKIESCFHLSHQLLNDQKIEEQEVDIVLRGRNDGYPDGIIEVRYAPQPIRPPWLRENISNAMVNAHVYRSSTSRRVEVVILIIAQKEIIEKSDTEELRTRFQSDIPFAPPRLHFLPTEKIEALTTEEWRDLIFPGFEPKPAQTISERSSSFVSTARRFLATIASYTSTKQFEIPAIIILLILEGYLSNLGNIGVWFLGNLIIVIIGAIFLAVRRQRRFLLPPGLIHVVSRADEEGSFEQTVRIPRRNRFQFEVDEKFQSRVEKIELRAGAEKSLELIVKHRNGSTRSFFIKRIESGQYIALNREVRLIFQIVSDKSDEDLFLN